MMGKKKAKAKANEQSQGLPKTRKSSNSKQVKQIQSQSQPLHKPKKQKKAKTQKQSQQTMPPQHQLPVKPQARSHPPNLPSRPPPRSQSPLRNREIPRGPRGDNQAYSFGGPDSYRPSRNHLPERAGDERLQFTFGSSQPPSGPRFPQHSAHDEISSRRRHPDNRQSGQGRSTRRSNGGRPRWTRPPPTHDRPIIQALNQRGTTPERLMGMTGGNIRFKALDELSESMSESESDEEQGSNKRRKVAEPDAPPRPQWTNPDPYTALPPTFEPDRKKIDVVQFIRKAKFVQEQENAAKHSLADNADFVSLAFSDDEEEEDVTLKVPSEKKLTPHRSNAFEQAEMHLPPPPPSPPAISNSRKRKYTKAGDISTEWIGSGSTATPWKQPVYAPTGDMNWRLHQEILDFHSWVKPRSYEHRIREHLVARIEDVLCTQYREHRIRPFGSFASGLYLPTGDMDLVLVSRQYERGGMAMHPISRNQMHRILNDLIQAGIARTEGSQVVHKAKVPIIKFVDHKTGLHVDISFENLTGVVANATYSEWKAQFPDLPFLVCIIKQFLLMRNLNELDNPSAPGTHPPARNLGQLLIDFLDFYGKRFDMTRKQICLRPPGHLPKPPKFRRGVPIQEEKWSILDPNQPGNDISAGSTLAPLIAKLFSEAADTLRRTMAMAQSGIPDIRDRQSILGCILGGSYDSFDSQRDLMDRLDKYYMSLRT